MSHTYACFDCMNTSRRVPSTSSICPICGKNMIELPWRVRVPKRKRKLWDEFKQWLKNEYVYYREKI